MSDPSYSVTHQPPNRYCLRTIEDSCFRTSLPNETKYLAPERRLGADGKRKVGGYQTCFEKGADTSSPAWLWENGEKITSLGRGRLQPNYQAGVLYVRGRHSEA